MYLSENTMIVEDSLNRVDSLLSIQPLKETNNPIVPLGNDIEFKNVSFKYKDESAYALKNINLKIKQNSITALVGPSGGGKSTIASLIQRFYDVDEGEIAINGVDIRNIETKTLMNKIAYDFFKMATFKNFHFRKRTFGSSKRDKTRSITCSSFSRM